MEEPVAMEVDAPVSSSSDSTFFERLCASLRRAGQHYLDRSVVWVKCRWLALFAALGMFLARMIIKQGFYLVAYCLGIYILNLFICFLSPAQDPLTEGPVLPTSDGEEFRPFVRSLPEFQFWFSAFRASVLALFLTFFQAVNLAVYWPILLAYFILLFVSSMRDQLMHMIKYNYVPINLGKKTYGDGKKEADAVKKAGREAVDEDAEDQI